MYCFPIPGSPTSTNARLILVVVGMVAAAALRRACSTRLPSRRVPHPPTLLFLSTGRDNPHPLSSVARHPAL